MTEKWQNVESGKNWKIIIDFVNLAENRGFTFDCSTIFVLGFIYKITDSLS